VVDLSAVLLADEMSRAAREGWSGVLALTQGEVTKGLYLVDGEVAFAASTVEEDRLGAHLYRSGKITEAQFRSAMKASERPGHRLGQALIEAGILSAEELAAAVAAHVERIVLSVLRWTKGEARREPMHRPIPSDLALHLGTHRLLVLGMRQFPDVERLARPLGDPERRFRRSPEPAFAVETLGPTPVERAVIAVCVRGRPLADLLALPHPRAELLRAVYGLLAGGILEDVRVRDATPVPPIMKPTEEREPLPAPDGPLTAEEAERSARSLLEKGYRPRALEVLARALERDPEAHRLRRLLAMTEAGDGGFEERVERDFLTALEKDPADTELRHALASYYRRAAMPARAALQLRLLLSTDPTHAGAWRDLGELEASEARRKA
jgi:tetratricopeptide (TPR) repeat protein